MLRRHIFKLQIFRNRLERIVNIPPANTLPPTVAYKITHAEYQVIIGMCAIFGLQLIYDAFQNVIQSVFVYKV